MPRSVTDKPTTRKAGRMTKTQARKKTRELICIASRSMRNSVDQVLDCDALNLDDYEDDYQLPKIIICAMLKEIAGPHGYEPLWKRGRTALKRLHAGMPRLKD
jgi:hypothetical protein